LKTYVFDVDGTVCTTVDDGDYLKAKPYKHRIKQINYLYEQGHTIIFHTARGMGRHRNIIQLAVDDFYLMTRKQLFDWDIKFHKLFMGKPSADIYIDDKGITDEDFFNTGD
jgi:hypothetical protein